MAKLLRRDNMGRYRSIMSRADVTITPLAEMITFSLTHPTLGQRAGYELILSPEDVAKLKRVLEGWK